MKGDLEAHQDSESAHFVAREAAGGAGAAPGAARRGWRLATLSLALGLVVAALALWTHLAPAAAAAQAQAQAAGAAQAEVAQAEATQAKVAQAEAAQTEVAQTEANAEVAPAPQSSSRPLAHAEAEVAPAPPSSTLPSAHPDIVHPDFDNLTEVVSKPVFSAARMRIVGNASAPSACVVATGASENHFDVLEYFIAHWHNTQLHSATHCDLHVWDIGLREKTRKSLAKRGVEVRIFPFADYPKFVRGIHHFAWKPIIVEMEKRALPAGDVLVWLDAGCPPRPTGVENMVARARHMTVYSPRSQGTIHKWVHPKTLQYLNVPREFYHHGMVSGGIVSVADNPVGRAVIAEWAACARVQECIAPIGSDLHNHRQDQAALTVIMLNHSLAPGPTARHFLQVQLDNKWD